MDTRFRIVTQLGLCALVAGCSSINVNTDFDPLTVSRVGSFETYAWLPRPSTGEGLADNSLVEGRVIRAVDAELEARGYRQVQRDPDFLVGWHVGFENKVNVSTMNSYYGYGYGRWRRGGGVWMSDQYVSEYTQGTLILDIVEGSSNELVWRGAANGKINPSASPEERERRVQEAVDKILERFPPSP